MQKIILLSTFIACPIFTPAQDMDKVSIKPILKTVGAVATIGVLKPDPRYIPTSQPKQQVQAEQDERDAQIERDREVEALHKHLRDGDVEKARKILK